MERENIFETFVDSVLIVDDKEDEIKELQEILEKKDIWVTHIDPPKNKNEIGEKLNPYRNRKLIFFDLHIDEAKDTKNNLTSIIRPLLERVVGKGFGSYGIVMWTKHDEDIDLFKEKIKQDKTRYDLPLFVIGLDKNKYLSGEKKYENIFEDLKEQLKNNTAANFFINWNNIIEKGKHKTIESIYELVPDYKKQDKNLEFILFKIAQNYIGTPLEDIDNNYNIEKDLINSFNDVLRSEVTGINSQNKLELSLNKEKIYFTKQDNNKVALSTRTNKVGNEVLNIYSLLNNKLLIDEKYLQQGVILPGNVYKIKQGKDMFKLPDMSNGAIPIVMEMTPPCDFSNKKALNPRLLAGYIADYKHDFHGKESLYKELMPISINAQEGIKMIIFDFRVVGMIEAEELKDKSKYELIFRANDKLFADILQKMSSHIARLGLSIIK